MRIFCAPRKTKLQYTMDYVGNGASAVASMLGGYTARKAGLSPVGALTVAGICGVGGGTIRDSLVGRRAFWVDDPRALYIAAASGAVGYYGWEHIKRATKVKDDNVVFDTLFTVAMGGASLAGISQARACFPSPRADLMLSSTFAMLSAVGGGMIRDVVLGRPVSALRPEGLPSVMPALVATGVLVAADAMRWPRSTDGRIVLGCAVATFVANPQLFKKVYSAVEKYIPKDIRNRANDVCNWSRQTYKDSMKVIVKTKKQIMKKYFC